MKKQKDNLGMGETLAPFMANFCLRILEKHIKEKEWFPKFWVRYMDDVLAIVKQGSEEKICVVICTQKLSVSISFSRKAQKHSFKSL
jgi:hypothetical protein